MGAFATIFRELAQADAGYVADATERQRWIDEKGMRVFSMYDPRRPFIEVDLFVDPPISFEKLRANAVLMTIEGVLVPVAGIADLIAMKRIAGRPKDLEDIAALEAINEQKTR